MMVWLDSNKALYEYLARSIIQQKVMKYSGCGNGGLSRMRFKMCREIIHLIYNF